MRATTAAIAIAGLLALWGCDKGSPRPDASPAGGPERAALNTTCSSPTAAQSIHRMILEEIETEVRAANKGLAEDRRLDLSKVRALANELSFELTDIITTKNDPDSTKRFCEGQLTMRVSQATLDTANQKRRESGQPQIQTAAEDANFKVDLNKFVIKAVYSVQSTDDGQKLFLVLDNGEPVRAIAREIVVLNAISSRDAQPAQTPIQDVARNSRPAANEPAAPAVSGLQAPAAVSDELASSMARYASAEREINVIWKALPKDIRDANLDAQRAFNTQKETVCFKEATVAGEGEKFEMAKNACWTRFYQRRIPELRALALR